MQFKDAEFGRIFDVIVVGGEPCGIASAVAAARSGARTLLVEPTAHLGGHSTSGLNTGELEHMLRWTLGGVAADVFKRLGEFYGSGGPEYFFESGVIEKIFSQMLLESGVEVSFACGVRSVRLEDGLIRHIELSCGTLLRAGTFVDASYEGDLMALAGVDSTWGRESADEFGEEAAGVRLDAALRMAGTVDASGRLLGGLHGWVSDVRPGEKDHKVMCYNLRPTLTRDPAWRVPIPEPSHYDREDYRLLANWLEAEGAGVRLDWVLDLYERRHSKLEANNCQAAIVSLGYVGGQFAWPDASPEARKKLADAHVNYALGLFHFLAHDDSVPLPLQREMQAIGLHAGEFADNGHLPYRIYVREARRMRGAVVVTQHDVTTDRRKDDSIAMGSHFVDCHHVQRLAVSECAFVNEGRIWRPGYAYQIPYRAMLPQRAQCRNLLVPGAASFSHVAFSTYRLESVWMLAGHAAGTAAALAAQASLAVQDVDIRTLQQLLRQQGQVVDFLPGCPERYADGDGGWPAF